LKSEFQHLSGPEIRDLKLAGTEITTETQVPVVAYTGDTNPNGLDNNEVFFQSRILITEMTFVAPEHRKEKIHKHGHMHLDDIKSRQNRFDNELIIASHLSTRYSDSQVRKFVNRGLPGGLDGRLKLWI
jgi:ribonuclease Z